MMINVENSKLFTPWKNPETGVTIYLLTKKVAPVQEAFYFVNESISHDGRFLWFYCAFPPSGTGSQGRTLGVVDFEKQEVRHFPDTQFNHASPMVEPATGEVYWGMGPSIYRRGPDPDDPAVCINSVPQDLIGGRTVSRIATHLTRSCDGKNFFVDTQIGLQFVFGTLPVDGSDFQHWHTFTRNYNHAQFSPTDPNTVLFAQEIHPDPITGLTFPITNRLWILRPGEEPRAILREPRWVSHEWWDPDGEHAWSVWKNEAWKTNIHTGEVEVVNWPSHCWHAHATHNAEYIIADTNEKFFRGCPSGVGFLNRQTGRFVKLVDNPGMSGIVGANYHIDPHPRFNLSDQYVTFTTTIRGEVDLAVAKTSDLVALTS